jgi:hypothetical protein
VALGTHRYSLLDTVEQIPVVISGRPSATRLEVNVIAATASLIQSDRTSSLSLTGSDGLAPAQPQAGTTPSGDVLTNWAGGAVQGDSLNPTAYSPPWLEALHATSIGSGATLDSPPWLAPIGPALDLLCQTC